VFLGARLAYIHDSHIKYVILKEFEPLIKLSVTFANKKVGNGNLFRVSDVKNTPAISFCALVCHFVFEEPPLVIGFDGFWANFIQPSDCFDRTPIHTLCCLSILMRRPRTTLNSRTGDTGRYQESNPVLLVPQRWCLKSQH